MSQALAESMAIHEVVAQSGLSEHTLRYYEKIGLITPIPRDDSSGHRRYSPETVQAIEALSCLRKSGLSIEDMRQYLAQQQEGVIAAPKQKALFADNLERIDREIEVLLIRRAYIESKLEYWTATEEGDMERAAKAVAAKQAIAQKLV